MFDLIKDYNQGLIGEGIILLHQKPHKNGSGDLACVLGIQRNCENVVNCSSCYLDKTGGYCVKRNGESVNGFLVLEPKHSKLVEDNSINVYTSIADAINSL